MTLDPQLQVALDLVLALVGGGAIGWERSAVGRAAGLRTHILIAMGAATIASITIMPGEMIRHFPPDTFHLDPARLVQGIMTGIGFLGAGVIVRQGVSLYGLASAASIWVTAAVGLVFGLGYILLGGELVVIALITLRFLRRAELSYARQVYAIATLRFRVDRCPDQAELRQWFKERDATFSHISVSCCPGEGWHQFAGPLQVAREDSFAAVDRALPDRGDLVHYDLARNNQ